MCTGYRRLYHSTCGLRLSSVYSYCRLPSLYSLCSAYEYMHDPTKPLQDRAPVRMLPAELIQLAERMICVCNPG
eukprot:scaffold13752_cov122-Isochrysis_galbana.AAC.4